MGVMWRSYDDVVASGVQGSAIVAWVVPRQHGDWEYDEKQSIHHVSRHTLPQNLETVVSMIQPRVPSQQRGVDPTLK